jgi:glycerophosphoryl diester phosphodiesterase
LILRLYVERGVRVGALDRAHWGDALEDRPAEPKAMVRRLEWGVAGVVVAFGVFYLSLTAPFDLAEQVEVTAHRGYSRAAPENTLAAIRKAIDVGSDWAEIDVQLTADGEVVLLHDNDLRRMTGDPRRLAKVRYAELKDIPLDRRFGAEYARERIPSLREVIRLARGRIKLNIELKFPGRDRTLAKKAADLLREEEFEDECFVASLDAEGVRAAKKHNPRLRTAAIITAAVGDISRLDVDILSVNTRLATDDLLHRARRLGKQVHVWTVNEPRAMRRLIEHGVDNVITDDPERFLEIRRERSSLGDGQRLLLACRYLLE